MTTREEHANDGGFRAPGQPLAFIGILPDFRGHSCQTFAALTPLCPDVQASQAPHAWTSSLTKCEHSCLDVWHAPQLATIFPVLPSEKLGLLEATRNSCCAVRRRSKGLTDSNEAVLPAKVVAEMCWKTAINQTCLKAGLLALAAAFALTTAVLQWDFSWATAFCLAREMCHVWVPTTHCKQTTRFHGK